VLEVLGGAVQLCGALKAELGPLLTWQGGGGGDVAGEEGEGEGGCVETSPVEAAESVLQQCLEMVLKSTANDSTVAVSGYTRGYTTIYPTLLPGPPPTERSRSFTDTLSRWSN